MHQIFLICFYQLDFNRLYIIVKVISNHVKQSDNNNDNKSNNRQPAAFIFTYCIALASSLPLLAGLLIQSLFINSVAMPVSKYGGGKFTGVRLCLAPAQNFTKIFGQVRLRGLLMFFDIIFIMFISPHCNPLNMLPVRQHTP